MKLKNYGFGISSTTISPSPFHTYTKTPDVQKVRMSPKDKDLAALPTMGANEVAAVPRHQCNGAPPPISTVEYHLRAGFQNASFATMLHADNQDDPTKNYQTLLDNPAYFNFTAASQGTSRSATRTLGMLLQEMQVPRNALIDQLEAVKTKLGDSLKLPPEMKGAGMVVVTQAVAQACKGFSPEQAARGLKCLSEVNLHASIANPATSRPPRDFDDMDLACAWRIAQALEETPIGFAALKKIAQSPYPEPGEHGPVHASITSHDDKMLHVFLQASREKTRLNQQLPAHPQAIFNDIPDIPSKLIDKSLLAVRAHLTQSCQHVGNNHAAEFTPARDANEWAIGAVINGFYTDEKKDENGNITPFHKAEERLKKMSKWVSRANGTNNKDTDGANSDVLGKDASKVKKVTRFLRNTLLPGMKKSPFNALNRQVPDTILPYAGATSGSAFRNAEGGGLGEARAILDMVNNVEKALERKLEAARQADPAHGIANPNPETEQEMLTDIVRLEIIKQVKADTKGMFRYVNCGLNDKTRTKVKESLYAALRQEGGLDANKRKFIKGLVEKKHTNLTPETLVEWAEQAGCPRDHIPNDNPSLAANQPDWRAFRLAQKRATEPVRPTATPDLKTVSKAQVAQIFGEDIKNHELGSRVTLYSGGMAGVGTKSLTTLLSRVISKGILKVTADVRGEGARCATAEIGTGAQGNELFLGTQRMAKGQIGGGVGAGWKVNSDDDHVVQAGGSASAAVGMDFQDRNGVMIRFHRLNGGVGGDKANNAKLARVAGKLMAPGARPEGTPYANAQGRDGESTLKNLWQEWPEVSISLVEAKEKAGRASKSVSGGFGFKFGNFLLGAPNLGTSVEGKKGKSTWKETGGSLHVDKKTKYWTAKTSASASVGVGGLIGTPEGNVNLALGADVVGASVDFWKNGYNQTDVFIEHEGELKRNTVRIKTYQNAQTFINNVAPELDKWAEEKAQRFYEKDGYGADVPDNEDPDQEQQRIAMRNAVIEAEHTRLSQFLKQVQDTAEPTQVFWEFKELKIPAAAAANALKSVAHGASKCGDRKVAQECTKSRDKMLKGEEAWERTFLVSSEITSQQRTMAPVNFVLKAAQVDGSIVTNIKTFT